MLIHQIICIYISKILNLQSQLHYLCLERDTSSRQQQFSEVKWSDFVEIIRLRCLREDIFSPLDRFPSVWRKADYQTSLTPISASLHLKYGSLYNICMSSLCFHSLLASLLTSSLSVGSFSCLQFHHKVTHSDWNLPRSQKHSFLRTISAGHSFHHSVKLHWDLRSDLTDLWGLSGNLLPIGLVFSLIYPNHGLFICWYIVSATSLDMWVLSYANTFDFWFVTVVFIT